MDGWDSGLKLSPFLVNIYWSFTYLIHHSANIGSRGIPVDKTPQASGSSDGNKNFKGGLKKGLLETMHLTTKVSGINKAKTLRINH